MITSHKEELKSERRRIKQDLAGKFFTDSWKPTLGGILVSVFVLAVLIPCYFSLKKWYAHTALQTLVHSQIKVVDASASLTEEQRAFMLNAGGPSDDILNKARNALTELVESKLEVKSAAMSASLNTAMKSFELRQTSILAEQTALQKDVNAFKSNFNSQFQHWYADAMTDVAGNEDLPPEFKAVLVERIMEYFRNHKF